MDDDAAPDASVQQVREKYLCSNVVFCIGTLLSKSAPSYLEGVIRAYILKGRGGEYITYRTKTWVSMLTQVTPPCLSKLLTSSRFYISRREINGCSQVRLG